MPTTRRRMNGPERARRPLHGGRRANASVRGFECVADGGHAVQQRGHTGTECGLRDIRETDFDFPGAWGKREGPQSALAEGAGSGEVGDDGDIARVEGELYGGHRQTDRVHRKGRRVVRVVEECDQRFGFRAPAVDDHLAVVQEQVSQPWSR